MTAVFVSIKQIDDKAFKWIDTRFSLTDEEKGAKEYHKSHVAGAQYWHLNDDLSDLTKVAGRHPMPDKEALVELFQSSGLSLNDSIIVYDDGGSPFATRAWWLLQYAGFKKAVIALEGFEAIKEYGIPVDNKVPQAKRTFVSPEWNESIYATRDFIEQAVSGEAKAVLLDARAVERYRGEVEPLDPIAGRIPGALNFDWELLKKNDVFNLDESIRESLENVVKASEEVTVYCGSGVTAAPVYAMLSHFGYPNVRLYVGSYSDWIRQKDAEIEKG